MYIHLFREINNENISLVGGKGANLARLTREGIRVPPGFCLSTVAYQEYLTQTGLKSDIERLMKEINPDDIRVLSEHASEFSRLFRETAIPDDIKAEAIRAYRKLSDDIEYPSFPVAVRSSSTAEDMRSSSFAGQYDSFLNVRGEDELLKNLKRCWASYWNPQAIHYRHTNGFDHFESLMAVVVQQMIPSAVSGVLFTANPVSGNLTEMIINSSWGLGEAIVQGSVESDTFVLDRVSHVVKERRISVKQNLVEYADTSGTKESSVPMDKQRITSLSEEQLQELHRIGIAIEEIYQEPQDIEWGYYDDCFHILQTRPITGLNDFPIFWENEEDKNYKWTLPGAHEASPVLPLDEFRQRMFYEARMSGLSRIGGGPLANDYRVFNGYVYERAAPFSASTEELGRRKEEFQKKLETAWSKGNTAWHEYYFPYIDATNKRLKAFDLANASDAELIAHIQDVIRESAQYWEIHWIRGGREFKAHWQNFFVAFTGINDEVKALTAPLGPNKSTETIAEIVKLVELVKASPFLTGLFETLPPGELHRTLSESSQAKDFYVKFLNFIEEYGYKSGAGAGSHNSLSVPTWRDDPGIVLSIMSRYIPQQERDLQGNVHSVPQEALDIIEEAYEAIGENTVKREEFRKELELARKDTADQEDHNFHLDQTIIALLRLPCLEAGVRLRKAGMVENRDDIFFITMEELLDSLGNVGGKDLKNRVGARKLLRRHQMALKPPMSVGGDSEGAPVGDYDPSATDDVSSLSGTPASSGVVTGIARVIPSSEVVPDLKPGEILVSYNAGPMWTPLFPVIGGLVLDGGNVLLHAALVAREYKIPAVFLTGNATKIIQDGQTITVNGTEGVVYIHAE